ncbi:hypothetical protein D9619_013625 [Psilocybe cf. subviscida]|uniref:Uncharacterized protein n=1 Tax=Psilocybe cf. subviscida TaxID=2480587 RepID=A0A8H5F8W0_9AGAR|nr:hypothetical protein D9619_013625 [Psilocybe cf. subviscida]
MKGPNLVANPGGVTLNMAFDRAGRINVEVARIAKEPLQDDIPPTWVAHYSSMFVFRVTVMSLSLSVSSMAVLLRFEQQNSRSSPAVAH